MNRRKRKMCRVAMRERERENGEVGLGLMILCFLFLDNFTIPLFERDEKYKKMGESEILMAVSFLKIAHKKYFY